MSGHLVKKDIPLIEFPLKENYLIWVNGNNEHLHHKADGASLPALLLSVLRVDVNNNPVIYCEAAEDSIETAYRIYARNEGGVEF